jgi:hypothetical protein
LRSADTLYLTIYAPSALPTFGVEDIQVWSAGKQIFVENSTSDLGLRLQLFNVNGQVVKREEIAHQQMTFDVSNLSAGLYIAQLSNSTGYGVARKLILQ